MIILRLKIVLPVVFVMFEGLALFSSNNIDSVLQVADKMFYEGDFSEAIELVNTRMEVLNKSNDTLGLIIGNNIQANCYRSIGEIDKAEHHFNMALEYSMQMNDTSRIAISYENLSTVYTTQGKYNGEKAISFLLKSAELKEGADLKIYLPTTYKKLSSVFLRMEDKEKGKYYLMKALQMVKNGYFMKGFDAAIYNEVGRFYTEEEIAYDSAMFYYNKTLQISEKMGWKRGIAVSTKNIAWIYDLKGDYMQALKVYNESLQLNIEMNHASGIISSYLALGNVYANMGSYSNSVNYYTKAINKSNEHNIISELPELYLGMYKSLKKLGVSEKALSAHEQYVVFKDSISGIEQKKQIAELEAKYENEKKEQQIINLKQKNELQEVKSKQQRMYLLFLAALVVTVLILALLFVNQSKLKAKERETNIQQKLLRSQMNPHFIFNALGSIQNFIHINQPNDATVYLSKFAKLMRNILEGSLFEFIELDQEIEIVNNYLSLQKLRFRKNVDYKVAVDVDGEELRIPPMLAQPFIENAVEHGLKNSQSEGLVEVGYKTEGNWLVIEIIDNGTGVDSAGLVKDKKHKSYAISLTKQRLGLLHKECKIEVIDLKSEGSQGTRVTIMLPKYICEKF